jgi:hypothetical protein
LDDDDRGSAWLTPTTRTRATTRKAIVRRSVRKGGEEVQELIMADEDEKQESGDATG